MDIINKIGLLIFIASGTAINLVFSTNPETWVGFLIPAAMGIGMFVVKRE